MKGQTMEMLGFVILTVTVIGIILFMKSNITTTYARTFSTLSERQEIEGTRAGTNSVLLTTEEKTKKTMLELLGIAAYHSARQGTTKLNFGPVIGEVDMTEELEWRMNAIFGEGNWYVKIPYPAAIPRYQIVMIVDTSASLCDDFSQIKNKMPDIIRDLRGQGYNVMATVYMLPEGQECCSRMGVSTLKCQGIFQTERYLHCLDMFNNMCTIRIMNGEDWGRGVSCAVEKGPYEGWYDFTAKIGIILSDELPAGNEYIDSGKEYENANSLNSGIASAKQIGMRIFPIKTQTCGTICIVSGGSEIDNVATDLCCTYDGKLENYMSDMAAQTGGQAFELSSADQVTEKIKEIFQSHVFPINDYVEFGTQPPRGKSVKSVVLTTPITILGEYANIYISTWS